ncbi:MAG: septal ring lytic transglycosylase RlpA family protein [Dokdonella sp.]|uniref:septal ring lytic transglycosylase RlpA family protein n=1 Tax=Dokdonella sp. TaxID=2291710 RepID=UPI002B9B3489|nr:septal ring lytic transglycosylase RlpA family protein [Dokdonella sp.]HOX71287.1 septal ring lytic transglycosylase RlpA family protein [Dokdonella sp.]HPN78700.1 septal ring lytic transglycosylase RlpA family protein [Dokdonella sp.]
MNRALTLVVVVLLLSACASNKAKKPSSSVPVPSATKTQARAETDLPQAQRYRDTHDGGPAAPATDIARLVEPVPKHEPRARYGNKSPYSVLGKTYAVMPDAHKYVERGIASWYGNKFHGYMTSSLEPYDMYQFSAAHKTLPLPSYVRVTNLDNGKSVVVRVNDRGPFHENRLIDLSYAAAVRIGVWPKGTGLVEVRVIEPGKSGAGDDLPPQAPAASNAARIFLQLGAFADKANAAQVVRQIERQGLGAVSIVTTRINDREIHRVRLGPLQSVEAADALVERIERLGLGTPRVAVDD